MDAPVGWIDIGGILPVLLLLFTGFSVLVLDLYRRGWNEPADPGEKSGLHFLSLLGTVVAGALITADIVAGDEAPRSYFADAIRVDRFSDAVSLIIIVGTLLTLLGAPDSLRRKDIEHGEFHCLVLCAAAAMILFAQSTSLIMVFLSLETLSMGVYVLTAFSRDEKRSVEGALKYFVLGGLSSGFLLFGLALLYGATGKTNLADIEPLVRAGGSVDVPLCLAGGALVLVGLGFKVGAFPFHSWVPDVYEGALSVVSGFMAVTVKAASFAVLLRVGLVLAEAGGPQVREAMTAVLGVIAFATMIFGNLVALVQTSVKRMLAYSAIAHTGYLLVGVVAGLGPQTAPGKFPPGTSILFYLLQYSLISLAAFALVAHLGEGDGERETFESYRGLSRRAPRLSLAMLVLMASFAGIPPTPGFWGKLYIFSQAIETGHWVLALTGILASVVSVVYYLGLVATIYMRPPESEEPLALEGRTWSGLAIALAVAGVLLMGIFPDLVFELSARCAP
jgi:NADH-quinone oxidoreductase subunit N